MTDHSDDAELKALAVHATEQTEASLRILYEEHSASFRWQMASLLALNGGGLLSIKDVKFDPEFYALVSAISFFLGLLCALLIAFIGQKSNQKMLEPVTRMGLYWRSVSITGKLNDALQTELNELINQAAQIGRWPSKFGIASFIFFSIGLLSTGLGWQR